MRSSPSPADPRIRKSRTGLVDGAPALASREPQSIDRGGLLEAQVARADRTLFPVDCVSHTAVAVIKRVTRSTGKPYVPLRSSGLTSFTAALRSIAAQGQSTKTCSGSVGARPA
ncbi:MAG: DUF2325 domain-containing protein [Hyphomicrobiaceae bacterium]|nr:DUF2325 domain-containing protein [Hyphomicrobiaceae bacterium]